MYSYNNAFDLKSESKLPDNSYKAKVMREVDLLIKFEKAKREREIYEYHEKMKKLDKLLKLQKKIKKKEERMKMREL